MDKLEGLELRKAALTAAGWEARQITPVWTDLFDHVGEFILGGTGNVWDDAPPVESSVDAALQWLTLGEGHYWKLIGQCEGGYYVHIATETETTWISIAGQVDRRGFAPAMCDAYRRYKAGA